MRYINKVTPMKKLIIALGAVSTIAVTAALLPARSHGEIDLPFLNQKIDQTKSQVDALDARTTNNESDIKTLQDSTGTAPGEHVAVPTTEGMAVTPTAETLTMQPAPAGSSPETVATVTPAPTPVPFVPYTDATLVTQPDGSHRLQCVYHPNAATAMLGTMPKGYDVSQGCPAQ